MSKQIRCRVDAKLKKTDWLYMVINAKKPNISAGFVVPKPKIQKTARVNKGAPSLAPQSKKPKLEVIEISSNSE